MLTYRGVNFLCVSYAFRWVWRNRSRLWPVHPFSTPHPPTSATLLCMQRATISGLTLTAILLTATPKASRPHAPLTHGTSIGSISCFPDLTGLEEDLSLRALRDSSSSLLSLPDVVAFIPMWSRNGCPGLHEVDTVRPAVAILSRLVLCTLLSTSSTWA